jgi:hypothetical protein
MLFSLTLKYQNLKSYTSTRPIFVKNSQGVMLAYFICITSESSPSYDVIFTWWSKTLLAMTSKDNSTIVPTLHERFKAKIWSEKERVLRNCTLCHSHERQTRDEKWMTFKSVYWKCKKMQQGGEEVGKD